MDDFISRKMTLDAMDKHCEVDCDRREDNWCPDCQYEEFKNAITKLPSQDVIPVEWIQGRIDRMSKEGNDFYELAAAMLKRCSTIGGKMGKLISLEAAISEICDCVCGEYKETCDDQEICSMVLALKSTEAQPNNKVHLCDSCQKIYPECESTAEDIIFGNGVGNDNICACACYEPKAQAEPEHSMEEFMYGQDMGNPEDGSL